MHKAPPPPVRELCLYLFASGADAALGGDGDYSISQLGEHHAQQIQLIIAEPAGKGVGHRRDGGCEFAGIHNGLTSRTILCRRGLRGEVFSPFNGTLAML